MIFLVDQLKLILSQIDHLSNHGNRYTANILTQSFILYASSPIGYSTLRDLQILTLLSSKTLTRLSQPWKCEPGVPDEKYLKLRTSTLNNYESHVVILMDEVCVNKKIQLVNGSIVYFQLWFAH